ncbi:uncharacterized protein LOC110689893 [Chenopodium quinoa]|uniref:uncharacterized protein LOC110689893 n=1 Tax=Chenopodium quinoa TaxID=63459 RepID=UPI000B79ABD2|nr:uncharacterized protein LOC110689893 [Chenopodium quinoa]
MRMNPWKVFGKDRNGTTTIFICRGHILNGMEDDLFDVYQNVESAKELWESLESKYMAEDASSKKFLVSNFNNYKFVDGRSIMDQFHELQRIYGSLEQHGIAMNELFVVFSIIDKLPPSWKNVKHDLKHKKEDMTLSGLATHLQIEEGIRAMEGAKDGNPSTSTVNMVDEGRASASTSGKSKNNNSSKAIPKSKQTITSLLVGNAVRMMTHCELIRGLQGMCARVNTGSKTFQKVVDGEDLYLGNNSTIKVLGRGQVELVFSSGTAIILRNVLYAPEISRNLVSMPTLNSLGYKLIFEANRCIITRGVTFTGRCYLDNDEALTKFDVYKREVELQVESFIKRIRTDKRGEYYDPAYFQSLGIIHETTAGYAPQSNGVAERKQNS